MKKEKGPRKYKLPGYTLIEMMLVVLLSGIMYLTVVVSAQTGLVSMRVTDVVIQLNDQLRQAAFAFAKEIAQSSPSQIIAHFNITTDGDDNSIVIFQVPVDADGDTDWGGDPINSDTVDNNTEYVQWGAHSELGAADSDHALLGQWIKYSVQNNQLIREVLLADQVTADPLYVEKVIANDISRFKITQNLERLAVELSAKHQDRLQGGAQARAIEHSYETQVVLRNDAY